jgi:NADPH-dependent 7-cyano-7-deazaguanine reductase QueF
MEKLMERLMRMKLEEAEQLANQIVQSIKHLCDPEHIMIVGSIRRARALTPPLFHEGTR